MKLIFHINDNDISFYNRLGTTVALATYSAHFLIMGNRKLAISVVSMGLFESSFYRNVIEQPSTFHMHFFPNRWIRLVTRAAQKFVL